MCSRDYRCIAILCLLAVMTPFVHAEQNAQPEENPDLAKELQGLSLAELTDLVLNKRRGSGAMQYTFAPWFAKKAKTAKPEEVKKAISQLTARIQRLQAGEDNAKWGTYHDNTHLLLFLSKLPARAEILEILHRDRAFSGCTTMAILQAVAATAKPDDAQYLLPKISMYHRTESGGDIHGTLEKVTGLKLPGEAPKDSAELLKQWTAVLKEQRQLQADARWAQQVLKAPRYTGTLDKGRSVKIKAHAKSWPGLLKELKPTLAIKTPFRRLGVPRTPAAILVWIEDDGKAFRLAEADVWRPKGGDAKWVVIESDGRWTRYLPLTIKQLRKTAPSQDKGKQSYACVLSKDPSGGRVVEIGWATPMSGIGNYSTLRRVYLHQGADGKWAGLGSPYFRETDCRMGGMWCIHTSVERTVKWWTGIGSGNKKSRQPFIKFVITRTDTELGEEQLGWPQLRVSQDAKLSTMGFSGVVMSPYSYKLPDRHVLAQDNDTLRSVARRWAIWNEPNWRRTKKETPELREKREVIVNLVVGRLLWLNGSLQKKWHPDAAHPMGSQIAFKKGEKVVVARAFDRVALAKKIANGEWDGDKGLQINKFEIHELVAPLFHQRRWRHLSPMQQGADRKRCAQIFLQAALKRIASKKSTLLHAYLLDYLAELQAREEILTILRKGGLDDSMGGSMMSALVRVGKPQDAWRLIQSPYWYYDAECPHRLMGAMEALTEMTVRQKRDNPLKELRRQWVEALTQAGVKKPAKD